MSAKHLKLSDEVQVLKKVNSDGNFSGSSKPILRLDNQSVSQQTSNGKGDQYNGQAEVVPQMSKNVYTNSSRGWKTVDYSRGGRGRYNSQGGRGRPRPDIVQPPEIESNVNLIAPKPQVINTEDRPKDSYSKVLKSSTRNRVIYGSLESKGSVPLKTVKRMFWLFLSGFDPLVTTDEILAYLKDLNGSADYGCYKLDTRYDTYSSFKVGVPLELADELMHPNLWPQGCIVAKYQA
ncbi:hypothetical protein J6590_074362, partial [Homalodisca vitripennis]